MSEYLVLLLTSENCGHCISNRGDGILNNGKILASSEFFKKLVDATINNGIELLNIHFSNMSASVDSVKDVSKYYINEGKVFQEKYSNNEGKVKTEVYQEQGTGNKRIFSGNIKEHNEQVQWQTFLDNKISSKINLYGYFFPCFLITTRQEWKKSVANREEQFLAIANAGYTIRDKHGIIQLEKNPKSISARNKDIFELIKELESDKEKFKCHKDYHEEAPKEEESPKEEVKKPISNNGYIIKGFDDY